jgi:hypothetical protein
MNRRDISPKELNAMSREYGKQFLVCNNFQLASKGLLLRGYHVDNS